MKHPEFEKLVKNFEGLLSLSEEQEVSAHLVSCADCVALAAKLEKFFGYASAEKHAPVSQADTARLLNIFKPEKTVSESKAETFAGRLLASLVFDDWRWAVEERFVASDTRHLLYRAGRFEIDLRLLFTGGKCQMSGQVFPNCARDATAEIFSGAASEKVFLNEYCEFVFPLVEEGVYKLRFASGDEIIEIENLSLES